MALDYKSAKEVMLEEDVQRLKKDLEDAEIKLLLTRLSRINSMHARRSLSEAGH